MNHRTTPAFRLTTLGELALHDEAGQAVKLRTRKSLLLLACLAVDPDQSWSRERLATMFWGDRMEEQARNSLRSSLSDIRRVLGGDALDIEGNAITLAAGVVGTDIADLRAMTGAAPGDSALAGFYGGDFLADSTDGNEQITAWSAPLRTEARELAAQILERAIANTAADGAMGTAIARARELLSLDPLSEKSHRMLMRLYADSGERSKALAQFQSCVRILQHELGVAPSGETQALADEIAVHSPTALSDLRDITDEAPATGSVRPEPLRKSGEVSIAVLPFLNMSGDADQDYFAEGISEDITTDLSKVPDLFVAASGSTRMYRTSALRPDEIAAELGVVYVLEGSVRRFGDNTRITASLIDARNNRQIWAERFDRSATKVFEVQSEIAERVAGAVQSKFLPAEAQPQSASPGTTNSEAREHYLRGRALLHEMTRKGVSLSRRAFEEAIAIDPDYAQAHAGVAVAISILVWNYTTDRNLHAKAIEHSQIALKLDPNLAEAHCALGIVHFGMEDFEQAERDFLEAIRIDPNLPDAHYYRGISNLINGKPDVALAPLQTAFAIVGSDLQIGMMVLNCLEAMSQTDEAQVTAEQVFDIARRRMKLNAYDDQAAYVGAMALNALDRKQEALRWANIADAFELDDPRATYNLACLFALLREHDKALEILARTLELGVPPQKQQWIRYNDSDLDLLREDPRFEALFERLKRGSAETVT